MAKYLLVDVINEVERNVLFGTCELCMFYGDHHYSVFVLRNAETGEEYEIEMGEWSWGDYDDLMYNFDNVNLGDFAEFLHVYNDFPEDPDELSHNNIVDALWEFEENYKNSLKFKGE